MFKVFVVFLAFLSLTSYSHAYRILVFFPMPSKSHSILGHGVVNRLLEAGHEVVHVTGVPRENTHANLTEISLTKLADEMFKDLKTQEAFKIKNMIASGTNVGDSPLFMYFTYEMHRRVYDEGSLSAYLSDPQQKFDAVIVEWFFHNSVAGLASVLQCPLIWYGSTEAHWQILRIVDEIPNPAYSVEIFSGYIPPLNFWQRTLELWTIVKKTFLLNWVVAPFERSLYNRVYSEIAAKRGVPLAPYDEAIYNGSLLLLNAHPVIGSSIRLPQMAKSIAGYHIDTKVKPLPQDLNKLMEDAKHGFIYMSMGSNFKSVDMSEEMKETLLKTFGKLKQTVLWKFEGELENLPSNVHLIKWAPQQSILANPNLKIFITHGGQLSTTEAFHFGVPLIGLPVAADQHVNMISVSRKGFCIHVNLRGETFGSDLSSAIDKMLNDPSYKIRAKEMSQAYHDRPVPPGKELVHWVEHVVRTRGAPHLRSPALLVPWYQKMYLDLAALIVAVFAILIGAFKKFLPKKTMEKVKNQKKQKQK